MTGSSLDSHRLHVDRAEMQAISEQMADLAPDSID
jgi:hypothetical protein